MGDHVTTARGVYIDLEQSPYEYRAPYGEVFKFSSAKKMEMFTRDIDKEVRRLDKLMDRHDMREFILPAVEALLCRAVYRAFYRKIER